MKKNLITIFGILAIFITLLAIPVLLRQPRSDRNWEKEFAYTPTTSTDTGGIVSIKNIRDYTYGDSRIASTTWIPVIAIDPKKIVRVWFILEPFAKWKAVGHTFLTFELADGSAYSFSVEARREEGETYSTLKGLLRNYEMAYTWGTERDLIPRRVVYLNHPVRMYPLNLTEAQMQGLFKGVAAQSNELAAHPRFYNTLTANCTNMLAHIVNDIAPGTIPYDISWNLPGYSDTFLSRIGLIKTEKPIQDAMQEYDLTKSRQKILEAAALSHAQFSKTLRGLLPKSE